MARPDGITTADEERWTTQLEEYLDSGRIMPFARLPRFREMFFAGEWLGEQLTAAGLPPGDASDICFANGQKTAAAPGDPWAVARETLAQTLAGCAPKPGPRIAASLTAGRSVAALLNPAIERGITPEEMERNVDGWRETPRYPREEPAEQWADLFRDLKVQGPFPERVIEAFLQEYRRLWEERGV